MQVVDLEPHIHAILSAPGTDLSTISAKRVRRLLLEQEDVTQDLIKDNKLAIDELISTVFARVSEEKGFQHDEDEGAESAEPPAPPKKRHCASLDDHGASSPGKPAKVSTAGDEALARQLSEAINGRGRSSRSGASGASSTRARGRGRGRGRGRSGKANGSRSADTIDDSGSDGDESKKKRGRGLSKEYILRSVHAPHTPVPLFTSIPLII
jgi:upstream activation factor subunit UAF30